MTGTTLLIGTRKGLLLARRDGGAGWELDPIAFPMQEVPSVAVDTRGSAPRLFAGVTSWHWGPSIVWSDDLGRTWNEADRAPVAFPEHTGATLTRIWQVRPGAACEPDVVYAGAEPAALFRSEDRGQSFTLVDGLWDHPHREQWMPGGGGLGLHTVLPHPEDPQRMHVAISSGGVYRTADGGATWEPANTGIRAPFLPEGQQFPEFGQCVHKVDRHPSQPDRLFLQHHFGVYRSDDDGSSWQAMESGLPTNFGFPVVVHPRQPQTAYVFPLVADMMRVPPDEACRVFRTTDGGGSWEGFGEGLPGQGWLSCVLRDGFCADDGDPTGLYFGSRTGEVYASQDDGERWELVAEHLPDVLSVRAVAT